MGDLVLVLFLAFVVSPYSIGEPANDNVQFTVSQHGIESIRQPLFHADPPVLLALLVAIDEPFAAKHLGGIADQRRTTGLHLVIADEQVRVHIRCDLFGSGGHGVRGGSVDDRDGYCVLANSP